MNVILQITIPTNDVQIRAGVREVCGISGKTVRFAVCAAIDQIRVRVRIGEGTADNQIGIDAIVAADLNGGVIHADFVAGAPFGFTAINTSPGANRRLRSANVAQTFGEVIDFISPLNQTHGVDRTVVGKLSVSRSCRIRLTISRCCSCPFTVNVAFFDHFSHGNAIGCFSQLNRFQVRGIFLSDLVGIDAGIVNIESSAFAFFNRADRKRGGGDRAILIDNARSVQCAAILTEL